ncbi:MAG: cytochrome P450, partial [Actinobacteria bacterium]|nr:cytochrome P450 [Actinomycetota bacterium]
AQALGEARLKKPTDDLTSIMMQAEVDGERMTSQEFGSFFILLVVAGNETTRNAISHGMLELTRRPEQRRIWFGDFEKHTRTAVEEIVRWASPVIHFRRTATQDTELRGIKMPKGTKVVMWYNSGNRDEDLFNDPYRFDVTRVIQPAQIGFGAGGPHFCLGANLARREIAVAPQLRVAAHRPDVFVFGQRVIARPGWKVDERHLLEELDRCLASQRPEG